MNGNGTKNMIIHNRKTEHYDSHSYTVTLEGVSLECVSLDPDEEQDMHNSIMDDHPYYNIAPDKETATELVKRWNAYYTHLAEIDMLKEREEELTRALEIAIVWLRIHVTADEHSRGQAQSWRDLIDKNMPTPPEQTQGERDEI